MIVLSLEAERIMSGFSDDVANAVTQPLWPAAHALAGDSGEMSIPWSVPLKTRLSAMLCGMGKRKETRDFEAGWRWDRLASRASGKSSSHTRITAQFGISLQQGHTVLQRDQ